MKELEVIEICKKVLERLSIMGYERKGGSSSEQLVFPNKLSDPDKRSQHIFI